ncbi:hypothetical protein [Corallococcus exercitus]|uniref:hypothetical protein n=1 Tax=Corallococcus exercitus TaxID=2316736 RepID=UPI0035D4F6DD
MLVYGDHPRTLAPTGVLGLLRARLRGLATLRSGLERHAELVTLFIEASVLAQGLLDADAEASGEDEAGPRSQAWLALPQELARLLSETWDGGTPSATAALELLESIEQSELPARVKLKEPEGYAHFALYPELYLESARASRLPGSTRVVGVRSIGTGLACIVAVGLGASTPPITVRPVGPPFERQLRPGPRLTRELEAVAHADAVAIVDEGPGLSGSSFGAVADFLEARGMPRERLHFFPSHAGPPGPMASEHHRARWTQVHRHTMDFDLCAARLPAWVEDLTGPAIAPLEDISAGAWRSHTFPDPRDWPAVHTQQERRKYLLTTERGTFLLRFAGLGIPAEHRAHRARQLAEAGFTPPVEGLRHGFLVQPWLAQASPSSRAHDPDRADLRASLGSHAHDPGHADLRASAPDRAHAPDRADLRAGPLDRTHEPGRADSRASPPDRADSRESPPDRALAPDRADSRESPPDRALAPDRADSRAGPPYHTRDPGRANLRASPPYRAHDPDHAALLALSLPRAHDLDRAASQARPLPRTHDKDRASLLARPPVHARASDYVVPEPRCLSLARDLDRAAPHACPLPFARDLDRAALLEHVGRYLGFRARAFPVLEPGSGAPMNRLLEMARYNTACVLGEEFARVLDAWTPHLDALARTTWPVETDHKLQAWEWLVLPEGQFLKTDAVDHHAGLDLVGCQDVAWDIVGATVELGLSEPALATHVERTSGRRVSPLLLRFYRPCYLAFQCGHHTLAATALEKAAPGEATRLRATAAHYAAHLRDDLSGSSADP